MAIKDILADQSAWLDSLQKALPTPSAATGSATLAAVQARVATIQTQINDLTAQKAAMTQRFDAAILRQQNALTALQASLATNQINILHPVPPPSGTT